MDRKLIATLTGHDRVGFVESVTGFVAKCDGNVEASRMARLGGEFAMLLMVSVPESRYEALESGLQGFSEEGMVVTTRPTDQADPESRSGWLPYTVRVQGADHQGIIHQVSQLLAGHGINVESMDTDTGVAPMSGTPLFTMEAVVLAPPDLSLREVTEKLEAVADEMNVDVEMEAYRG